MIRTDRIGMVNKNKFNTLMKIIEYDNALNIIVEFQDKYRVKVRTTFNHFERGEVKNPYDKTIYGIGYIGEGDYKVSINRKATIAYKHWQNMLIRCYYPYYINKYITYKDVIVCEEWHNFQNFAKWHEENHYKINGEIMCLDKDILIKGNKMYSPETCVFVPQRINKLFTKCDKTRGLYPIGCNYDANSNKIIVYCNIFKNGKSKCKNLGRFELSEIDKAFNAYKIFKEEYIKQVADEYKDRIPKRLYDALYRYEVEVTD